MSTNGAKVDTNVNELGRKLMQQAEEARSEVVKQLQGAAEKIRQQVQDAGAPGDDTGAEKLAAGLEKAANYLNSHSLEAIGEDAVRVMRRNRWWMLVLALLVGIIIGRMTADNK